MCFPVSIFLHDGPWLSGFLARIAGAGSLARTAAAGLVVVLSLMADVVYGVPTALDRYVFDERAAGVGLASMLREVSGIAISPDGRLFAHNDEEGTVYQLDPDTGNVIKSFYPVEKRWYGHDRLAGDFEDIAFADGYFYLVSSSGVLYRFEEGSDGEEVPAGKYETFLDERFDVEGLCFDPVEGELLLACKQWPDGLHLKEFLFGKQSTRKKKKPVFAFSLSTMSLQEKPRFVIDADIVKKRSGRKGFRPSAIMLHPLSDTFLVVSSSAGMIAEFSRSGELLDWSSLSPAIHGQPEGIAVAGNGDLYISDEGIMHGRLTRYRAITR